MSRPKYTLYAIPRSVIDEMHTMDALDMLRYDGSVVQSNPPPGHYLFRIDGDRHPNVARWRSFGVPDVFVVDPYNPRVLGLPYWETNYAFAKGWVK